MSVVGSPMTPYSSSRGIMYTAPPDTTANEGEKNELETAEPVPADD